MKKVLLILLIAVCGSTWSIAQEEGIQFEHDKSFEEILALAKKSDKMIFMDCYTTWCGPCKYMTKNIFPQKSVGDFYNEKFVNVKMDMEKGEGIKLAEKYQIIAYPTLLVLDANGEVIHRKAGGMEAEDFIGFGKEATDPTRALGSLDAKYAKGDRSPEFLKIYTEARYNAADGSHTKIADEYLSTQDDWGTKDNMKFIIDYVSDADSKAFEYMIQNKQKFMDEFGKPQVTRVIQSMIYNVLYSKQNQSLEEIEKVFQKYFPDNADIMFANYKMSYYRQRGNREGYAQAAVERFEKFPVENYAELNETAWTFYQVIDDKTLLNKALGWAKKSVKMKKRYENLDTVAHLYHKLGKMKKAKCYAKKAIKVAKKAQEDYTVTQELLDNIQGK